MKAGILALRYMCITAPVLGVSCNPPQPVGIGDVEPECVLEQSLPLADDESWIIYSDLTDNPEVIRVFVKGYGDIVEEILVFSEVEEEACLSSGIIAEFQFDGLNLTLSASLDSPTTGVSCSISLEGIVDDCGKRSLFGVAPDGYAYEVDATGQAKLGGSTFGLDSVNFAIARSTICTPSALVDQGWSIETPPNYDFSNPTQIAFGGTGETLEAGAFLFGESGFCVSDDGAPPEGSINFDGKQLILNGVISNSLGSVETCSVTYVGDALTCEVEETSQLIRIEGTGTYTAGTESGELTLLYFSIDNEAE